jgi:hypothetical protein
MAHERFPKRESGRWVLRKVEMVARMRRFAAGENQRPSLGKIW